MRVSLQMCYLMFVSDYFSFHLFCLLVIEVTLAILGPQFSETAGLCKLASSQLSDFDLLCFYFVGCLIFSVEGTRPHCDKWKAGFEP